MAFNSASKGQKSFVFLAYSLPFSPAVCVTKRRPHFSTQLRNAESQRYKIQ